jgi:hypothetical protein
MNSWRAVGHLHADDAANNRIAEGFVRLAGCQRSHKR